MEPPSWRREEGGPALGGGRSALGGVLPGGSGTEPLGWGGSNQIKSNLEPIIKGWNSAMGRRAARGACLQRAAGACLQQVHACSLQQVHACSRCTLAACSRCNLHRAGCSRCTLAACRPQQVQLQQVQAAACSRCNAPVTGCMLAAGASLALPGTSCLPGSLLACLEQTF